MWADAEERKRCCWMYKSTNFLANHNKVMATKKFSQLLLDVQKY